MSAVYPPPSPRHTCHALRPHLGGDEEVFPGDSSLREPPAEDAPDGRLVPVEGGGVDVPVAALECHL